MTKDIEDRLNKIPVVNGIVRLLKKVKLPGLEGLSLFDLLERYIAGVAKGALGARASAISFSFFMAIFPFLLFILIVIPYVPVDDFKIEFLHFLESFLPPSTSDFFFESIFDGIDNSQRGGLLSSVFVLSIFLMANGVNAVFSGFAKSYHTKKQRSAINQYLSATGVALILGFLLILTIAVLGYFQIYVVNGVLQVLKSTGYEMTQKYFAWADLAQYMFFILMVYVATATMYYFGATKINRSKFFSVGALFTTVLIIVTSFLFSIYIENFGQYNKLYGSIGGLLILMFYLWLNSNILLLGYELNVTLQYLRKNPKRDD